MKNKGEEQKVGKSSYHIAILIAVKEMEGRIGVRWASDCSAILKKLDEDLVPKQRFLVGVRMGQE